MDYAKIWEAVLSEWPALVSSFVAFIAVGMAWLNSHFQRKQTEWLETYKARFSYQFKRLERLQASWEPVLERSTYQVTQEDIILGASGNNLPLLKKVVAKSTDNLAILFQAYNKCGYLMDEDLRYALAMQIEGFQPHHAQLLSLNTVLQAPIKPDRYEEFNEQYSRLDDEIAKFEKVVSQMVVSQLLRISEDLHTGTKLKLKPQKENALRRFRIWLKQTGL